MDLAIEGIYNLIATSP